MKKDCFNCKHKDCEPGETPCFECTNEYLSGDNVPSAWKPNDDAVTVIPEDEPIEDEHFDSHYSGAVQPIEFMQDQMEHSEFIGFLKGNIIKYIARMGKKDDPKEEAAKINRYVEWLEKALRGKKINPRD